MWIPYDLRGSLKAETDAESLRASRLDETPREFLVGFLVRNPVTQVWELDVVASRAGEAVVSGDADGTIALSFCGNEAGKLAEVVARLTAVSADAALARAHDAVQRRLLRYVIESGRGMAIAGWRIADPGHGARWRCTPFRPSALQLDHGGLADIPADLLPFASLFQRARNASDASDRLLAAYAILAAAGRGHPALARAAIGDFRIGQEMLVHAGALELAPKLEGRSLAVLLAVLQPEHDRLIGPGGLLAAAADGLANQQALARLANLADLAAHRLLARELAGREKAGRPAASSWLSRLRARPGAAEAPASWS